MVLLTITPSIAEALKKRAEAAGDSAKEEELPDGEPNLENPSVGDPISHDQIIDLWRNLRCHGRWDFRLESLLRGAKVYVAPPPPKAEPTEEFKVLMARLRREEEQRTYERMINPAPPAETFSRRYPNASTARAYAEVNRPNQASDVGDDDVSYNDVHRQVMLIVNFMASILGVAGALWVLGRWWSTPARLFLAMGGSIAVGIAEVVLYSGYIWHLGEAKKKESKVRELKEVVQSWAVGGDEDKRAGSDEPDISHRKEPPPEESSLRRRRQKEPS